MMALQSIILFFNIFWSLIFFKLFLTIKNYINLIIDCVDHPLPEDEENAD